MKKSAPKKLVINRETIAKLEDEKLPRIQGGGSDWMWGCSFQCPTSTGGFCDHIC